MTTDVRPGTSPGRASCGATVTRMAGVWDIAAIAARLGVGYATVRTYHGQATRRRRERRPLPGDLPAPDVRVGQSPGWYPDNIEAWIARRPGRGFGAGRPPGQSSRVGM